jgi:hypothetical protein
MWVLLVCWVSQSGRDLAVVLVNVKGGNFFESGSYGASRRGNTEFRPLISGVENGTTNV